MSNFARGTERGHPLRWLGVGLITGLLAAGIITQGAFARPGTIPSQAAPETVAPGVAVEDAPAHSAAPASVLEDAWSADELSATLAAADTESEPSAALLGSARTRLANVPFRTQRDGSQYAGSNCGPATLAMVLESYGISQENNELRYLTHTYQGTWPRRGGTALQHMAQVGIDFGLQAGGLYDGDSFRHWRVADVRAELEQGHPVIALVKYRLLPGREYSTVRYDHYVVLWNVTPQGVIYNDPIYPSADEGFARFMTDAQLDAAMGPTMEPRQAVAFY